MKRVYENFQILVLMIDVGLGLFCGEAQALPQDWPCFEFEIYKVGVIQDSGDMFEYQYRGETEQYIVDVNLMGDHTYARLFADCGTSGCGGVIMDKKTGYSEDVNFFCEEYSTDYTSAKCNIGKGDELIFIKQGKGMYIAHYCADDKTKTLAFNRAECDECQCVIRWYDNGVSDIGELNMGCQFEDNNAHCFTYNGYEKKFGYGNKVADFENCIAFIDMRQADYDKRRK